MFNPLSAFARHLDRKTAESDALMRTNGHLVQCDGRWSRTYRPDFELIAAQRRAADQAEDDRRWLELLAETDRKAALADAYRQSHPLPAPAPAPAVTLDQVVAALAERFTDLDRITLERLVIERSPQIAPTAPARTLAYDPRTGAWS